MTLPPFIQKYLPKRAASRHAGRVEPERDWLAMLSVFLLLLAASLAWNVWFFGEALAEKEPQQAAADAVGDEKSAAERAAEALDARAAKEAQYRSEYRFVDPSK